MLRFILPFFLSLMLLSGCKKDAVPAVPLTATKESAAVPQGTIEACSLLSKEEVAGVQATEITDTKSSESGDGRMLVSQCYYSASEASKSVSFTLIQNTPGKAGQDKVEAYWKATFGRFKDGAEKEEKPEEESREKGREESEKETPPQRIEGLGGEAYWAANPYGGALYVFKKGRLLRISVGGPGEPPAKLERSKMLAEKALAHL